MKMKGDSMRRNLKRIAVLASAIALAFTVQTFAKEYVKPVSRNILKEANARKVETAFDAICQKYPNFKNKVAATKWCAHQGYSGLAPGNSAAAYVLAGMSGAIACEGDVHITKNGDLYMSHGFHVSDMTGVKGGTFENASVDIAGCIIGKGNNVGYFTGMKICSFSDYLKICKEYNMKAYIHLKCISNSPSEDMRTKGLLKLRKTISDCGMDSQAMVLSENAVGPTEFEECTKDDGRIKIPVGAVGSNETEIKKIKSLKTYKSGRAWAGHLYTADFPYMAHVRNMNVNEIVGSSNIQLKPAGTLLNNNATVSLDKTSFVYTGSEIKEPVPTVKIGGAVLEQKTQVSADKKITNYAVRYSDNINVGSNAKVTVYGLNNYNGEVTATFKITPADINGAAVKGLKNVMYDGNAKTLDLTLKYNKKILTEGTDYTVSYSGNTNVGTASVIITGKGNFKGSRTETFEITRIPVSKATSASISGEVYDGQKHLPKPSLTYAGKALVEGKNYTLSYKNNVNFGTAEITVTGTGVFEGTKTINFKIFQASVAKATVEEIQDKVYNGKAYAPNPTVTRDGRTLRKGTDYTIAYENNLNAGTAIVTIEGKGNYVGSIKKKFTIAPRSIAKNSSVITMYGIPTQVYNGKARTPVPVVLLNGETELKKGKHFNVTYENNVDKGTAKATVTGIGNFTGTRNLSFKIVDESVYQYSEAFIDVVTAPSD